jgi:hypothetical protein
VTGPAQVAWEMAYETGYQHAITLAAERVDELDAIWRPVVRPTYEEKVRQRMAHFEATFVRMFPDRTPYRGGPVDWDTGRPARAAHAERRAA